jgi:two-component system, OmpR family, response regulator ChvI
MHASYPGRSRSLSAAEEGSDVAPAAPPAIGLLERSDDVLERSDVEDRVSTARIASPFAAQVSYSPPAIRPPSREISRKGPAEAVQIAIVDDDDAFRESLGLNLVDEGYAITSFSSGAAALDYFVAGGQAHAILLDWRMPGMTGLELLRSLRRAGNTTPAIFLTIMHDDLHEEAALEGGAVDFVDKSRRLSILIKRLQLIAEATRPAPEGRERQVSNELRVGHLELRFDTNRASWDGAPVALTLTEFKIVALLAQRAGEDVAYREIYDMVHGKNFVAGYGDQGYRPNVRTFIKRIRKKFHEVDPEFDHIHNYAGFGYRYR